MTGLAILGLFVVALAVLDVVAIRWGADSRSGFENARTTPGLDG